MLTTCTCTTCNKRFFDVYFPSFSMLQQRLESVFFFSNIKSEWNQWPIESIERGEEEEEVENEKDTTPKDEKEINSENWINIKRINNQRQIFYMKTDTRTNKRTIIYLKKKGERNELKSHKENLHVLCWILTLNL